MKSLLLFAISFLCFSQICFTQTVWPGDVNNNGIVNEVDLLYLGFAFNQTGSPRTATSTDWVAQEVSTAWDGNFPSGLSFAYADCNGDGIVDVADAAVIELNLTEIHTDVPFIADEILEAIPGVDPEFNFLNDNLTVAPGETIDLNISLGSDDLPVPNLSGIAFTVKVDPRYFQTNRTRFDFNDVAWINPFGSKNTSLILEDEINGQVTVAFSVTDGAAVSGAGLIGTISFVTEDDIINFLQIDNTAEVEVVIDSITLVTDALEQMPLERAKVILDIEGRSTSTYNPILDKIQLYPNPTANWILLKTNEIPINRVELVNALGQIVYQKELDKNSFHSLDLQQVPEGMYWLRMITEYGIKNTPVQKL